MFRCAFVPSSWGLLGLQSQPVWAPWLWLVLCYNWYNVATNSRLHRALASFLIRMFFRPWSGQSNTLFLVCGCWTSWPFVLASGKSWDNLHSERRKRAQDKGHYLALFRFQKTELSLQGPNPHHRFGDSCFFPTLLFHSSKVYSFCQIFSWNGSFWLHQYPKRKKNIKNETPLKLLPLFIFTKFFFSCEKIRRLKFLIKKPRIRSTGL